MGIMKTTRELAREESLRQIVNNLQVLLVKNYDANKGFKKAFQEVENQNLKEYFKGQAFLHHRYATQLDNLIHSFNHTPLEEGSPVGRFHRIWMDIMISLSGNDDKVILEECQRGQKATLREYKDNLKNCPFPTEIKEVLKKQLVELEFSFNEIPTIKDPKKR